MAINTMNAMSASNPGVSGGEGPTALVAAFHHRDHEDIVGQLFV